MIDNCLEGRSQQYIYLFVELKLIRTVARGIELIDGSLTSILPFLMIPYFPLERTKRAVHSSWCSVSLFKCCLSVVDEAQSLWILSSQVGDGLHFLVN